MQMYGAKASGIDRAGKRLVLAASCGSAGPTIAFGLRVVEGAADAGVADAVGADVAGEAIGATEAIGAGVVLVWMLIAGVVLATSFARRLLIVTIVPSWNP